MLNKYVKHRGRYFIKKTFQVKIILQFIAILAFEGIISGVVLYFFASNELETKLYQAHLSIINTLDILLPIIIITSISVVVLLSFITIYTVLYLSHRIAGPLYKFEKITDEIGDGNLNISVQLRQKDELLPLKTAFENMIENLQIKIRNFKKNFKKIKLIEEKLNNVIQTSVLPETDKNSLTTTVKEFISEYEKNMNAFITKDI